MYPAARIRMAMDRAAGPRRAAPQPGAGSAPTCRPPPSARAERQRMNYATDCAWTRPLASWTIRFPRRSRGESAPPIMENAGARSSRNRAGLLGQIDLAFRPTLSPLLYSMSEETAAVRPMSEKELRARMDWIIGEEERTYMGCWSCATSSNTLSPSLIERRAQQP
jgi:hypothetical protein